jgi:diadenosine tetraphosphate (Ap4A) HIT family hydrolase
MRQLEGCNFCIEAPELKAKSDIPGSTVLESDNFRVYPTLGMITPGYLLIVPKEHVACVGAMAEPMLDELIRVKEEVDSALTAAYCQKPVYFEHGVIGQTVSHAQVHAIPATLRDEVVDRFLSDFPRYNILKSMKELPDIWKNQGAYLYYETGSRRHVFTTRIVPMYARIVVADALGVPERANWRTMDRDLDNRIIAATLKTLRKA